MVAEALDKATQEEVVEAFRQELKKPGRLLACLEFAAKLNRELGAAATADVGLED
jgi:hypothetical protein